MKLPEAILLLLAITLAGCAAPPPAKPTTPALPLANAPAVAEPPRFPEVVRAYAVGAYIDPDDPSVRHEAHWVHRVEAPARWDLRSPLPKAEATPVPVGNPAPAPRPAEPPAVPATPPSVAVAPAALESALLPNADGVVDLTVADPAEDSLAANPFAVRRPVSGAAREISLHVSAITGGAKPCALVNEALLSAGDVIETLQVVRIEDRSVLFRHGTQLVRLPLADRAFRLRLPQ